MLGAVFGAGVAAVVFAPALWLGYVVEAASGARVRLLDVDGRVWAGSATVALAAGAEAAQASWRTLPSRLHWDWGWSWREPLALRLRLHAACCVGLRLRVGVDDNLGPKGLFSSSGFRAVNVELAALEAARPVLDVPLAVLDGLGAPWNTLALRGRLRVQLAQALRWQNAAASGRLDAQLLDVGTALASRVPAVGSWAVQVQAKGETAELALSTINGPLHMQGTGEIGASGPRLRGRAWVHDVEKNADLANLLTLIGEREDAASVRLRLGH